METQAPPPEPPPAPAPTGEGGRLLNLDVIRGIAILGILLVNIISFGLPMQALMFPGGWGEETAADQIAYGGVIFFVMAKFYPMFAMMLGAGLAMQWGRQAARPGKGWPGGLLLRRLFWLGLLGIAHVALLWDGDILLMYALIGMAAVPLLACSGRTVMWVALSLFLISQLCCSVPGAVLVASLDTDGWSGEPGTLSMAGALASEHWWDLFVQSFDPPPDGAAATAAAHLHLGWEQLAAYRITVYTSTVLLLALELRFLDLLALMLVGALLWRSGVIARSEGRSFRLPAAACLLTGFSGMAAVVWMMFAGLSAGIWWTGMHLFGAILAVGYVGVLCAVPWERLPGMLTGPLAAVGRTALSNYLIASAVFTTLFNGYGFGLFGRFHYTELLAICAGFWVLQLIASPLWLRVFRFGPMEWLWRTLTYGRIQPIMRPGRPPANTDEPHSLTPGGG